MAAEIDNNRVQIKYTTGNEITLRFGYFGGISKPKRHLDTLGKRTMELTHENPYVHTVGEPSITLAS